ncbi:hypothetical protein JOB18_014937 [Solea senegalensis]|uniref:Uncharacterized protein n=1 Tax=Solea senegalensis TaxID=28829 RepID=A0AAV6Q1F9_SOLSE|nr:hypothetical protein JOB18_014937 [Solea senegalensis]
MLQNERLATTMKQHHALIGGFHSERWFVAPAVRHERRVCTFSDRGGHTLSLSSPVEAQHIQTRWLNRNKLELIILVPHGLAGRSLHRWGITHSESMERLAYSQDTAPPTHPPSGRNSRLSVRSTACKHITTTMNRNGEVTGPRVPSPLTLTM